MSHVLVIGGAGYIGSHTAHYLAANGYQPIIFDSLELGHLEAVGGLPLIQADYGDAQAVTEAIRAHHITAILHFGAYASVGDSVKDPRFYYETNIGKGLRMLGVALDAGVRQIIFSSSAATYGEPVALPITEEHPQLPTNPYGETKLQFERILQDYSEAFDLRSVSLRYFNAAGCDPTGILGEDHTPEQHLIPLIVDTALGRRDSLTVFGTDWPTRDGTCVRDYVHVLDLAHAHLLALRYLENGGETTAYNLGTSDGITVLEAIKATEALVGEPIPWKAAERRPGDPATLVASAEKIQKELGWEPQYSDIFTILKHVLAWRKTHPQGYRTPQAP